MDDNQTNLEGAEENEKKNAEQMDPGNGGNHGRNRRRNARRSGQ